MKKIILISILFISYPRSIKQDSNLEMILDNFINIYGLDKKKDDIYVNEIQTDNNSIIGVGIYVGSKIPNNSYDGLDDDEFYYSKYKGYRIYLRKYFIEDNIVDRLRGFAIRALNKKTTILLK